MPTDKTIPKIKADTVIHSLKHGKAWLINIVHSVGHNIGKAEKGKLTKYKLLADEDKIAKVRAAEIIPLVIISCIIITATGLIKKL